METLHQLAATHPYWSLEEFAMNANQWLPRVLPESKANTRVREDVNPRLIRQYTTLGLVDAPGKEGREARYGYRHLLQLLVTRRLLADGYATAVIARLMAGQDDAALEAMLSGGAQLTVATEPAGNPAMAFLQGLTRSRSASRPGPPPSAPMAKKSASSVESFKADALRRAEQSEISEKSEISDFSEISGALFDEAEAAPPAFAKEAQFDFAPPPAPAPAASFASSPAAAPLLAPAPPTPGPQRWLRLELAPGVELGVREDVAWPTTPADRQALLALIAERLSTLSPGP